MEIASPLPIPHNRSGSKRPFVCSPFLEETDSGPFSSGSRVDSNAFGSPGGVDSHGCGNMFKRRRCLSNDNMEDVTSSSLLGNASRSSRFSLSSDAASQHLTQGPSKRTRTDNHNHGWNQAHAKQQIAMELQRVVDKQAAEIERLKTEKTAVVESFVKLNSDHEKILEQNRVLKKAVTIQQERQNQASSEIEAACRYKANAEERIRRLEQMNLTLRYHLQAQQPSVGNDFMGFSPRPPDVF